MTGRAAPEHRSGMLDAAEAWVLLRGIRSEADAEAAGLLRTGEGDAHGEAHADGHGHGHRGGHRDRWKWRGSISAEAGVLLDRYLPLCLAGPQVTFAQLGQSLDGFIATRTGDADYVTGEEDRCHLHRLRALADAVVVGAGTAVADDPQLTVRACSGANPVRVVLDPHGRVPLRSGVFTDGSAPTLWVVGAGHENGRAVPDGVDVLSLPDSDAFAPRRLSRTLARRGLGRVLIEGGGITVSRFLHERALHRLYVTVAPVLLGDGIPGSASPARSLCGTRCVRAYGAPLWARTHSSTSTSPLGATSASPPTPGAGFVRRRPANHWPTSTAIPGRLAARASTPYTTETVSPSDAPSPAAPKAHAVTPSLGPQPPKFSGSAMASNASSIRGNSSAEGAVAPETRAASRNMARCPASTATEENTTPGQLPRASNARRASVSSPRSAWRAR